MRTSILITTVTAALLAGTSAFAQNMNQGDQKQEPKAAPKVEMNSGHTQQPAQKSEPANKNQGAQAPSAAPKSTTGQAAPSGEHQPNAAQKPEPNKKDGAQAPAAPKATTGQGQPNAQQPRGAEGQRPATPGAAQGQSANPSQSQSAGATVTLTPEQRTTIRTSVLSARGAPRVSNVNFSLVVGTAVPSSVHLVAVPDPLIRIHPAWRGFVYFIVGDQIVVVDPRSHSIVAVLAV